MSSISPTLWIVATPLGNLGDLTPRAREVLAGADVVLAEDTRRAGLLLQRAGLPKKPFFSLFDHNEAQRIPEALDLLAQGKSLALVSDAGTPLVSDPGYLLVRAVRQAGHGVVPIPGPSAPIAALMVSGLPPVPFTFLGFLPRKTGERRKTLEPFADLRTTLIFFERKNRLGETLSDVLEVLGDREVCLARELTKTHEQVINCRLAEGPALVEGLRGEFTVVVGPPEQGPQRQETDVVRRLLMEILGRGERPRDAVKTVQERVAGWSRKQVYDLYLEIKGEGEFPQATTVDRKP